MSLEGGNDRRALRSARFAEVETQAPRRRRSNSSQPSVALYVLVHLPSCGLPPLNELLTLTGSRVSWLMRSSDMDDQDWERMVVRGTCTTLEKEYLRLTSVCRSCRLSWLRVIYLSILIFFSFFLIYLIFLISFRCAGSRPLHCAPGTHFKEVAEGAAGQVLAETGLHLHL